MIVEPDGVILLTAVVSVVAFCVRKVIEVARQPEFCVRFCPVVLVSSNWVPMPVPVPPLGLLHLFADPDEPMVNGTFETVDDELPDVLHALYRVDEL
jgi:hypothetical protein